MRIVLFGDSVFAGYGLARGDSPAARLAALLDEAEIVAAGVLDETGADGLRRVATIESDRVLVEFGLNDAIGGMPRAATVANLRAIVAALGPAASLVEALLPIGSRWPALTDLTGATREASGGKRFVRDILAGLDQAGALQSDGLHPNAAGTAIIAERLAHFLREETGS